MVIQRLQSLLLLVASVLMACFAVCPIGQIETPDAAFSFTTMGFAVQGVTGNGISEGGFHTWYLFALSLTSMLLLLIDIFLFRNLSLQKKVCILGIVMTAATLVTACGLGYNGVDGGVVSWSVTALLLPVIAVILAVMAYCRIRGDQNKLKAVDRIR